MDKPCEICGDVGYEDVIRVCCLCTITREHPYCMRLVHEGDPEKWVCDECNPAYKIPLPSPVPSKKLEDSKIRFKINKLPLNSKVRYLSPEEAMGLESGATRTNISPTKIPRRDPTGFKSLPPRFIAKSNPRTGPPGFTKSLNARSMPSSSSDRKWSASTGKENSVTHKHYAWKDAWKESPVDMGCSSKNAQTYNGARDKVTGPVRHIRQGTTAKPFPSEELLKTNTERDNKDSWHTSRQIVQCLPSAGSGADVCTDAQPKSNDSESGVSSKVTMKFFKFLPNHPAESPTWRGNFKVTGNIVPCGFYDGIQAHPPSKVHRKVYEFSKQLPNLLQFQLLPRLNLWVELFDEDIPDGLDIGLYFLPSKRCEQTYSCLVEHLNQCDVLLKSRINDVELLIFSSKHLQEDCQRIDQRYFLWGVFRSCEDNLVGDQRAVSEGIKAPTDHQSTMKLEDMVIDMIGGEDMGNADVVVAKPAGKAPVYPKEVEATTRAGLDVTLEFSPAKVKMETSTSGGGGSGASHPWTSFIEDELSFERTAKKF